MKTILKLISLSMALCACTHQNPFMTEWTTPYGIPPFDQIQLSDYRPALLEGIKQQQAEVQAIVDNAEAPTFENTIAALDRSGALLSKVSGVLFNLSESDGDDAMSALMEEVTPILTEHEDNISMNKDLYARVKAVYEADQSALTREEQVLLKRTYDDFARSGIGLDEASQTRLKEINSRLSTLSQKFGNNLLAENNAYKAEFGSPVSSYDTDMTTTADRDRREKMFKAYSSRGANGNANDNKALVLEVLKLRAEKARLLGFDNFAAYQLDNKMAHDPETVEAFLGKIQTAANVKAREEVADMQAVMDEDVKAGLLPEGSKILPWDWWYYAERVRKLKYDLDESVTKPYFLCDNVREGVFYAAHKIYGVNFEKLTDVPVYNPEVQAYKLTYDDGSLIGIFFGDYFPRSTKRGGAWMNNFREQYVTPQGEDVRPLIANTCNFTPATDSLPSLLTVDEVQTMFHEFGHALHGFFSKCHYQGVSGTNVTRDFVETFSQFNENWAFQKDILAHYARHYLTGEVISDALVQKISAALKFNMGFRTSELAAASLLDMRWHELNLEQLEGIDIEEFERKVCKEIGLIGEIIPRYRTTYFNHIFNSGYSAGYYSYLWAEVLSSDAFEHFEELGIYNPEVAQSFKETFLEKGGSEEPMTLYLQFRGQAPDAEALVRARGL